jgi:hypothetical protein
LFELPRGLHTLNLSQNVVPDLEVKPPSTKEEASQSKKIKPPNFPQEFVSNLKLILA